MQLHDAPAPTAVSRTPAVRGTSAQSIARAIGAEITYSDDGSPSIEFPAPEGPARAAPYVPFSTSPRTVSRVETASDSPQPATNDHAPSAALTQNHPASPGGAPALDADQLYEDFLARLRRDVLHEREQHGMLVDDLP